MKNLTRLFLMLSALTFFSCDKNDDITVTINEKGSLQMNIVDNDKKPVENGTVTLIDIKTNSILLEEELNTGGIIKMDKILQGSYKCFISTEKEGRIYRMTTYFQIFSDDHKVVEYNLFSNVGKIKISTNTNGTVKDLTKYTVAIVPMTYYINSIDDIKKYAYFSSSLDKNGEVEISDIPAETQYVLYVYKDNEVYVDKSFLMEKKDLDILLSFTVGMVNVQIDGEIANYDNYEIIIAPSSSNADIDYIRANSLYSTKPDSKGKATFTDLLKTRSYNLYLIKNNIIFDQRNFYLYNNKLDIALRVGSISIKLENTIENPENYSIALSRYSTSDFYTLKNAAFADGKLGSNSSVKFTEIPVIQNYESSAYIHIYKGNKIYDYNSFYWNELNKSINTYLYIYE